MTIIRCAHDDYYHPFVRVTRPTAQNKALTYEALGMLTYLLSQADDWVVGVDNLIREGCRRDRVYRILKELTDAGHLVHERVGVGQSKPPVWADRTVYEQPITPSTKSAKSGFGAPVPEKPDLATTSESPPNPEKPEPAKSSASRAPLPAFQEHSGQEQELKEQKLRDKDQERDAPARESTPLTFAHANGFGRTSNGHNPAVLAVKAHPVFQAYVRGRGNIEPDVPPPNAPGMLETLKAIQADIDAGRYGVQDVEELTRFKVGIPHSKAFLLSYIKTDIADFVGGRGKGTKSLPPPSNRQRDPALKDFDARQMVAEMERTGQNDKGWNPFAKEETTDDARSSSDHAQPAKTS